MAAGRYHVKNVNLNIEACAYVPILLYVDARIKMSVILPKNVPVVVFAKYPAGQRSYFRIWSRSV